MIRLAVLKMSDLKTHQPVTAQLSEQKMSPFMEEEVHIDGYIN